MDRRFFLAIILTAVVVFITPVLFPSPKKPVADSARIAADSLAPSATATPVASGAVAASPAPAAQQPAPGVSAAPAAPQQNTVIQTAKSTYNFTNVGAAPLSIGLRDFRALRGAKGDVQLQHGLVPLLRYRLVGPADTVPLSTVAFQVQESGTGASRALTYTGSAAGRAIRIVYTFAPDSYVVRTSVNVSGAPTAYLVAELPNGITSQEADTAEDFQHLAYVVKPRASGAKGVPFAKLEPGEKRIEPGPITWAAAKTKYFIVGLLTPRDGRVTPAFSEVNLTGAPRTSKVVTEGRAAVVIPLANGNASFEMYAGPQEWRRLLAMGRGFEDANPYGGWFAGIVTPFATIVMRTLLWLKDTTKLSYGWVLIIFGIAIRLALWPLNQSAMRNNIKMQRIQPELQAVQQKYKNDPQQMQKETMRVYAEHNMSPFSAFSGCLPMLLPMPILFALFFVFRNTIEFRGVPFLWLPDISLYDPYYILPIVMGLSMYLLSWIGMRNQPPNPQAKMMGYLFPAMMTFFFFKFASGLNLYYTVQNIAALPQQWMLTNERAKAQPIAKPAPAKGKTARA